MFQDYQSGSLFHWTIAIANAQAATRIKGTICQDLFAYNLRPFHATLSLQCPIHITHYNLQLKFEKA